MCVPVLLFFINPLAQIRTIEEVTVVVQTGGLWEKDRKSVLRIAVIGWECPRTLGGMVILLIL